MGECWTVEECSSWWRHRTRTLSVSISNFFQSGISMSIHPFSGQDATDAFFSLHSKEAIQRWEKMHAVEVPKSIESNCQKPTKETLAFRYLIR